MKEFLEWIEVVRPASFLDCLLVGTGSGRPMIDRENFIRAFFCCGYVIRIPSLNSLAPDIVEANLAGIEPDGLSISKLTGQPLPEDWNEQRRLSAFRNGNPTTNWRQEKSCRLFAFLVACRASSRQTGMDGGVEPDCGADSRTFIPRKYCLIPPAFGESFPATPCNLAVYVRATVP